MSNKDTILKLDFIRDIGGEEGKNSEVKLAFDHQLNTHFAVKIVPKKELSIDFGSNDENLFFTEAKMLYQNQHPNIVQIQYASSCDDNIYFTMPYYKKGSLNSLMGKKFLTVREIIKYSLNVLNGIHYIHTNNLLHFDIKPTNILINDNGKAMVTDFGLSRYTDNLGVTKYSKFYKSHFPPECIEIDVATKSADIYQVGLTLYRMCNGNDYFKHQYEGLKAQGDKKLYDAIKKEKFPIREYLPHIPQKLRRIVNKAIKSNPDDRYETVLDMMNAISKIEDNLDIRFYMENKNTYVWLKDTSETYFDKVKVIVDGDIIVTQGKKVNKINGKDKNITKLNKSGYNNIKEAFKFIEVYIKS